MIKPKVKRCPFCCSENVHLAAQEGENGEDIVFIHCKDCDACGPSVKSGQNEMEEAINLWNIRWRKWDERIGF